MEKKRNSVEFKITGKYALFSDPITRVGGEKFSYQIPTYQALKGVLESIYWKPTFIWYVDAIRVMKKIQTEAKGVKPIKMSGGNDLSYYTYLRDVEYQVLAHFEWNEYRKDLETDHNENKHHHIAKRCIVKGGRRDIYLGTRECQGYVEPCTFGEGPGYYDKYGELDFGIQFHGYDYPDETGKNELTVRLWKAKMKDGIIKFPSPKECDPSLSRYIRNMTAKVFEKNRNFTPITEDISVAGLLMEE
jgi:CRISPR-associated protein Cas5d